ncbi:MAG: lipid-A-disaccharide synthase-related protein, partial [Prochlorococcaceae cyanobacterium ETNP1_MAG_9]|nr:lipid-A-disaccharide synthase-related protein [Prochlorococcaceae cyanobacterium ETNP1_MAG_9]
MDRISPKNKNVLVLSNGHGEDLIALRILQALHRLKPELKLEVISLVGEGRTFSNAIEERWLFKSGTSLRLPSGGFSNQSISGFIQDMFAGFLWVNFKNWSSVRSAAKDGSFIVAVGDLLPLFFAWSSGGNYAFIGTPKSDYTWNTFKPTFLSDFYHSFKGTEWEPWEWSLMKASRCKIVAVRDKLTARGLRKKNVRVIAPGNPMMDGFLPVVHPINLKNFRRLILLCGSRMPEAMANFTRLLNAIEQIESKTPLIIFVAIGSEPSIRLLEDSLKDKGYKKTLSPLIEMDTDTFFEKNDLRLVLGVGKFEQWSRFVEVGIANAGT